MWRVNGNFRKLSFAIYRHRSKIKSKYLFPREFLFVIYRGLSRPSGNF